MNNHVFPLQTLLTHQREKCYVINKVPKFLLPVEIEYSISEQAIEAFGGYVANFYAAAISTNKLRSYYYSMLNNHV